MLWKHTTVYLELLEVTLEPKARKFRFQVGGHSSAPLVPTVASTSRGPSWSWQKGWIRLAGVWLAL